MMKRVLILLMLLTACTVGPDYEQPAFFDDKALEQSLDLKPTAAKAPEISYLAFQDKTLNKLLEEAMRQAPTVRIALTRLKQARASLSIQKVAGLPTIDASGKYNYVKESRNLGLVYDEDTYQVGLDASWEIDIFGSIRRQTEAAAANARAAVANLQNVYVSLAAEVADQYISYRTAEQLLNNAQENLKLQSDIYQTVRVKFEAGLADEMTLDQAGYAVQTTQMQIPEYQTQKEESANALALLLGRLPGDLKNELAGGRNLTAKRFQYNLAHLFELPASVVRDRPDVKAAEESLIAQNALVGAAIADLYPKVSLSGLLGFESFHMRDLLKKRSWTYSYAPEISLPIFHWGALKNNVALQEAKKEEELVTYQQTLLQAAHEIKNAMTAIQNEYRRNTSAERAFRQMDNVLSLTRGKYEQGLVEMSDVLDAELRRLSAQNDWVNSNAAIYQNIIQFYKATGTVQ